MASCLRLQISGRELRRDPLGLADSPNPPDWLDLAIHFNGGERRWRYSQFAPISNCGSTSHEVVGQMLHELAPVGLLLFTAQSRQGDPSRNWRVGLGCCVWPSDLESKRALESETVTLERDRVPSPLPLLSNL